MRHKVLVVEKPLRSGLSADEAAPLASNAMSSMLNFRPDAREGAAWLEPLQRPDGLNLKLEEVAVDLQWPFPQLVQYWAGKFLLFGNKEGTGRVWVGSSIDGWDLTEYAIYNAHDTETEVALPLHTDLWHVASNGPWWFAVNGRDILFFVPVAGKVYASLYSEHVENPHVVVNSACTDEHRLVLGGLVESETWRNAWAALWSSGSPIAAADLEGAFGELLRGSFFGRDTIFWCQADGADASLIAVPEAWSFEELVTNGDFQTYLEHVANYDFVDGTAPDATSWSRGGSWFWDELTNMLNTGGVASDLTQAAADQLVPLATGYYVGEVVISNIVDTAPLEGGLIVVNLPGHPYPFSAVGVHYRNMIADAAGNLVVGGVGTPTNPPASGEGLFLDSVSLKTFPGWTLSPSWTYEPDPRDADRQIMRWAAGAGSLTQTVTGLVSGELYKVYCNAWGSYRIWLGGTPGPLVTETSDDDTEWTPRTFLLRCGATQTLTFVPMSAAGYLQNISVTLPSVFGSMSMTDLHAWIQRGEGGWGTIPEIGEVRVVKEILGGVVVYGSEGVWYAQRNIDPTPGYGFRQLYDVGILGRTEVSGDSKFHVYLGTDGKLRPVGPEQLQPGSVGGTYGYKKQLEELASKFPVVMAHDGANKRHWLGHNDGVDSLGFVLTENGLCETTQAVDNIILAGGGPWSVCSAGRPGEAESVGSMTTGIIDTGCMAILDSIQVIGKGLTGVTALVYYRFDRDDEFYESPFLELDLSKQIRCLVRGVNFKVKIDATCERNARVPRLVLRFRACEAGHFALDEAD